MTSENIEEIYQLMKDDITKRILRDHTLSIYELGREGFCRGHEIF